MTREIHLNIDGFEAWVRSPAEARLLVLQRRGTPFCEIWASGGDEEPALSVLLNGDRGWLMYLREPGDHGFSSRNPSHVGPDDAVIQYRLTNGQIDAYPASWALPLDDVLQALEHFVATLAMAPAVNWCEN